MKEDTHAECRNSDFIQVPKARESQELIHHQMTLANEVGESEEEVEVTDPKLFPEGTCTPCQNLTLHAFLERDRTRRDCLWVDHDLGMPKSCPMCRIIFNSIDLKNERIKGMVLGWGIDDHQQRIDRSTGRKVHQARKLTARGFGAWRNLSENMNIRAYADAGSYASNFVPGLRPPLSNLSDTTFQNISRWIKECEETHTACQSHSLRCSEAQTRYLPTRVVHVGSTTEQPHLHIPQTHQSDPYIASSHCWGTIPQIRTLNANIKRLREEITFSSLSKTFQDAIHVARRLGIEYIWIDSLCIIQDDKTDWLQESERMGNIYANAYLTIAATWAADGNDGLDSVRPTCSWLKFPFDGTDEEKGHMWFTDGSWTSETDLDDAPLNRRGWVFQEKTLSRRIVHYAASQIYWECKQRFVGEEGEDELHFRGASSSPTKRPLHFQYNCEAPSQFWTNVSAVSHIGPTPIERENNVKDTLGLKWELKVLYESWKNIVCYYTTRNFTKTSDRLIALRGIIRVVEKQTGLRCIHGHWDDGSWRFVRELMWLTEDQGKLSIPDDDKQARLCSSWSWASLQGPILDLTDLVCDWKEDSGLKDCQLYLQAIGAEVHVPWPSHPLKVSGMLQTVHKGEVEGDNYIDKGVPELRTFTVKAEVSGSINGWVRFDRADDKPETFQFSPIYNGHGSVIACLALVQRDRPEIAELCFERVGAGYVTGNGYYSFETCERSTYYII